MDELKTLRELAEDGSPDEFEAIVTPSLLLSLLDRLEKAEARYHWLANRVLACDYGDNDAPGEQIGWRIRHDLLAKNGQRQPAFMYGASINNAIDAQLDKQEKQ
jgi:hypothetical protein